MKKYNWNYEKNIKLKSERNISFEEVIFLINSGNLIEIITNPNEEKYAKQKIYVLNIDNYIYNVPYVESEDEIFLKAIIPSRKSTKKYLGEKMKYELDSEEKDIMDSINNGNWQKSSDENDDISKHIVYAKNYLKKDKRINILLSSKDLELIQRRAVAEGLSYQTLVSSILHKYINGYI
ncbi:MAG: hypothetical protein RO257_10025 [Candidatus Kapabacteria bacterium]|nr:hypothetical protein [Candidatus Kapabacteria bacterium]